MRNMKAQQGFTLIEIISVLVILGILAAVAVPKYYDMQKEAEVKAALGVVAESQARINLKFGQQLLAGDTCEQAQKAAETVATGDLGGWEYTRTVTFDDKGLFAVGTMKSPSKNEVTLSGDVKLSLPSCTQGTKTKSAS